MPENCVTWYTKMTAPVTIVFPEDKICCANCRLFCRYEDAFKRYTCRLTWEPLLHPFTRIGSRCPFKIEEEEEDHEEIQTTDGR